MSKITTQEVPELRFADFSDLWKKNTLGEIAKFSKGKGISKSDITENGAYECIRYGELYTEYNEIINEIKSKTDLNKKALVFSEENDVIIPSSGETQIDIATASCILKSNVALGGDLNIIKTPNNGIFLAYYLNNKKKKEIASYAQGNSVVHLYSKQLALLNLNLPTLQEQQKIANFLTAVDKNIHLLTQKKTLLEQYKKGVMQKIFNQEIRFQPDSQEEQLAQAAEPSAAYGNNRYPDWKMKKLAEIATKESSNISANTLAENTGKYKIYGATGLLQYVDFYRQEEKYISIVKDGAGVGRTLLCEEKSSVLGTLDVIKPKIEVNIYFLYSILNNINFTKYITGSTIPHIYFKDYSKQKIEIPCLEEQHKIATFLSALDDKITNVQTQIDHYTTWKRGLLQRMFV